MRDLQLASLLMVPRQWELLALLLWHPLLSQEDLCAFLPLQRNSLNNVLASLRKMGLISSELTAVGERWYMTEAGLRLLAASMRCHVRHLGFFPKQSTVLRQRGLNGLLRQVRHTAGVYSFFAELSHIPELKLRWWETGSVCERSFVFAGRMHRFRPDALAELHEATGSVRFWLEWDRGSESGSALQRKFGTYAHYLASREYAREHLIPPHLFCVAADLGQERRLVRAALAQLPQVPALACATTTMPLLSRQGICAPIWLPIAHPENRSPPEESHCRTLFGACPHRTGTHS